MPNWCEGVLKVRGVKENLLEFLTKGLQPLGVGEERTPELDECGYIKLSKRNYIKGTRRGFVYVDDELWINDEAGKPVVCVNAKFAWGISAEELLETCKKYKVDMKIYAFECGMCFNQDIEIVDGEIVRDEEIEFDDYEWECINPTLGG